MGAVTGEYSVGKKALPKGIYIAFFLNDLFSGGNKVFMLARSQRV